ncbi:MAG: LysR substrate-binding domain-containing protein [Halioglobus sp.]|jgi:DNA-binding transcriptional LysR family regulator|nr:LysR substrate-binding domain-containing protein [Halioglobus sp.]
MIELRHLRYFVAVAEELHFGRAAERLNMSQPPLSQQIKQMEDRLGFELFQRTKRRVSLTAPGLIFLEESRQVLSRAELAIRTGQQASRGEHGNLAIGFVSSASYSILPSVVRHFRQVSPGVDLNLRELSGTQQIEWLKSNQIDVGISRSPNEIENIGFTAILDEPFLVVMPEIHQLAATRAVSVRLLSENPFILFPRPVAPRLYDQIINICQKAGFSPRVVQHATQMQTIIGLVAAEIGISIVPRSMQNLQRPGVVYKNLKDVAVKSTIGFIYRKDEHSPVVQRFLKITSDQL